jgi:two-component system, cell cycle response regulator DivK
MEGIPTAEPAEVQSPATNAVAEGRTWLSPHQPVVLLVDDYQDCREMYSAYLGMAGFHVLKASNGLEALTIARRELPDLVLMDLGLPGIDGCETTRRLKQDPVTRAIPVVALTAQCLPEGEVLRVAGFLGTITKPCYPDELAQQVARALGRSLPADRR